MICPKCKELGQKSRVNLGQTLSTLTMSEMYWDEEGIPHHHDRNNIVTTYHCTNGHRIVISSTNKCPSCDFGNEVLKVTVEDIGTQTLTLNGSNIVIF